VLSSKEVISKTKRLKRLNTSLSMDGCSYTFENFDIEKSLELKEGKPFIKRCSNELSFLFFS
jgi:hypothetical protein